MLSRVLFFCEFTFPDSFFLRFFFKKKKIQKKRNYFCVRYWSPLLVHKRLKQKVVYSTFKVRVLLLLLYLATLLSENSDNTLKKRRRFFTFRRTRRTPGRKYQLATWNHQRPHVKKKKIQAKKKGEKKRHPRECFRRRTTRKNTSHESRSRERERERSCFGFQKHY